MTTCFVLTYQRVLSCSATHPWAAKLYVCPNFKSNSHKGDFTAMKPRRSLRQAHSAMPEAVNWFSFCHPKNGRRLCSDLAIAIS